MTIRVKPVRIAELGLLKSQLSCCQLLSLGLVLSSACVLRDAHLGKKRLGTVLLIANAIWKRKLMKEEQALIAQGKEAVA